MPVDTVYEDDFNRPLPVDHGTADASGVVHKYSRAAFLDLDASDAENSGDLVAARAYRRRAERLRLRGIR